MWGWSSPTKRGEVALNRRIPLVGWPKGSLIGWTGRGTKIPFHFTPSFWIQFFALFGPFDGARRHLFDQSRLDIFTDQLHPPICQKRRTSITNPLYFAFAPCLFLPP